MIHDEREVISQSIKFDIEEQYREKLSKNYTPGTCKKGSVGPTQYYPATLTGVVDFYVAVKDFFKYDVSYRNEIDATDLDYWLKDNIQTPYYKDTWNDKIYFSKSDDAVQFKLRWA